MICQTSPLLISPSSPRHGIPILDTTYNQPQTSPSHHHHHHHHHSRRRHPRAAGQPNPNQRPRLAGSRSTRCRYQRRCAAGNGRCNPHSPPFLARPAPGLVPPPAIAGHEGWGDRRFPSSDADGSGRVGGRNLGERVESETCWYYRREIGGQMDKSNRLGQNPGEGECPRRAERRLGRWLFFFLFSRWTPCWAPRERWKQTLNQGLICAVHARGSVPW